MKIARWGRLVFAAMIYFPCALTNLPADSISPGAGSFTFVDQRGNPDKPIRVFTYSPQQLNADAPIVFVMHGARRDGKQYRDQWMIHAEKHGFLLIVPQFSTEAYSTDAYQRGNMLDDEGRPIERSKWVYSAVEHLFDHVKSLTGNTSHGYFIYGHSAGGQFVHRMVLFLPEARFRRAIAANPGYYTMPDPDIKFPYGLRGTTASKKSIERSFSRDFVLLLGERDLIREDPNFRKTPQADAQGRTRFERGNNYFRQAHDEAARLNVPFAWHRRTVPKAGHSDRQMSAAAASTFFSAAHKAAR